MASGRSIEEMGQMVADAAAEMESLLAKEFTGLGPYTQRISDQDYPQWYEMMRAKWFQEQQAAGIQGWRWPDGSVTLGLWDKALTYENPKDGTKIDGGVDEHKRYLRTKLAQVTGVKDG